MSKLNITVGMVIEGAVINNVKCDLEVVRFLHEKKRVRKACRVLKRPPGAPPQTGEAVDMSYLEMRRAYSSAQKKPVPKKKEAEEENKIISLPSPLGIGGPHGTVRHRYKGLRTRNLLALARSIMGYTQTT